MNHVKKTVNIVGFMEHSPIIARIVIANTTVANIKPNYVTRWMKAHINENGSLGWKNKSKVHQNG